MRTALPSLKVYHPVTGIEPAHLAGLEERVTQNIDLTGSLGRRFFVPYAGWQSDVLREDELWHLQRRFGLEITPEKIDKLEETIRHKLAGVAGETVTVSPAAMRIRPERITAVRRTLSIAADPTVIAERGLVKAAVLEAFDIDGAPEDVWFEDGRLTAIDVARSDNRNRANALKYLYLLLKCEPQLLPAQLQLQPFEVVQISAGEAV